MLNWISYAGLALSACIAATLLPMQSEAALVALLTLKPSAVVSLVAVAALGNVIGSQINWWLGTQLHRWQHRRWFPATAEQLARAQLWYQRYGRWSLLLSWMPVIGDPLTLVAGVLREPFWRFTLVVSIAKTGRYIALAYVTLYVLQS
ncbi:YqaA family protein [Thiopseudomonas denitrificans]|uniref:Membrane protein YqaA with SNARE-associated domain n=1 Tax=Thiopseudomonas denitrificans TaxID=1501432 RepID=A0A4R6TWF8_9GAMM|nr:YqaA family protein [Thiopseudomonas denitrificans]TDQ38180.1 membrane protein YqaA with SNARE-associated domain [Thiopseudomonas denitrificans]